MRRTDSGGESDRAVLRGDIDFEMNYTSSSRKLHLLVKGVHLLSPLTNLDPRMIVQQHRQDNEQPRPQSLTTAKAGMADRTHTTGGEGHLQLPIETEQGEYVTFIAREETALRAELQRQSTMSQASSQSSASSMACVAPSQQQQHQQQHLHHYNQQQHSSLGFASDPEEPGTSTPSGGSCSRSPSNGAARQTNRRQRICLSASTPEFALGEDKHAEGATMAGSATAGLSATAGAKLAHRRSHPLMVTMSATKMTNSRDSVGNTSGTGTGTGGNGNDELSTAPAAATSTSENDENSTSANSNRGNAHPLPKGDNGIKATGQPSILGGGGANTVGATTHAATSAKKRELYAVAELRSQSGKTASKAHTKPVKGTTAFPMDEMLKLKAKTALSKHSSTWRVCIEVWDRDRFGRNTMLGCLAIPFSTAITEQVQGRFLLLDRERGAVSYRRRPTGSAIRRRIKTASTSSTALENRLWRDVVSRSLYEACTSTERSRQQAIFELAQSEEAYVRQLRQFLEAYPRVELLDHLTLREYEAWFGEMRVVLQLAEQLVTELRDANMEGLVLGFGEVMVRHLQALEPVYTAYCTSNAQVTAAITTRAKQNPTLADILARGCTLCGGLDVHSYRLKPLQRITKYPLLLRGVVAHTARDHEDHEATASADESYRAMVDNINEKVRAAEWQEHLRSLAARLDVPKKLQPFALNPPGVRVHREYVFRQPLTGANKWLRSSVRRSNSPSGQQAKQGGGKQQQQRPMNSTQPHRLEDLAVGSVRILLLSDDLLGPYLVLMKVGEQSDMLLTPRVPLDYVTLQSSSSGGGHFSAARVSEPLKFKLQATLVDRTNKPITASHDLVANCAADYHHLAEHISSHRRAAVEDRINPLQLLGAEAAVHAIKSQAQDHRALSSTESALLTCWTATQQLISQHRRLISEHEQKQRHLRGQINATLDVMRARERQRFEKMMAACEEATRLRERAGIEANYELIPRTGANTSTDAAQHDEQERLGGPFRRRPSMPVFARQLPRFHLSATTHNRRRLSALLYTFDEGGARGQETGPAASHTGSEASRDVQEDMDDSDDDEREVEYGGCEAGNHRARADDVLNGGDCGGSSSGGSPTFLNKGDSGDEHVDWDVGWDGYDDAALLDEVDQGASLMLDSSEGEMQSVMGLTWLPGGGVDDEGAGAAVGVGGDDGDVFARDILDGEAAGAANGPLLRSMDSMDASIFAGTGRHSVAERPGRESAATAAVALAEQEAESQEGGVEAQREDEEGTSLERAEAGTDGGFVDDELHEGGELEVELGEMWRRSRRLSATFQLMGSDALEPSSDSALLAGQTDATDCSISVQESGEQPQQEQQRGHQCQQEHGEPFQVPVSPVLPPYAARGGGGDGCTRACGGCGGCGGGGVGRDAGNASSVDLAGVNISLYSDDCTGHYQQLQQHWQQPCGVQGQHRHERNSGVGKDENKRRRSSSTRIPHPSSANGGAVASGSARNASKKLAEASADAKVMEQSGMTRTTTRSNAHKGEKESASDEQREPPQKEGCDGDQMMKAKQDEEVSSPAPSNKPQLLQGSEASTEDSAPPASPLALRFARSQPAARRNGSLRGRTTLTRGTTSSPGSTGKRTAPRRRNASNAAPATPPHRRPTTAPSPRTSMGGAFSDSRFSATGAEEDRGGSGLKGGKDKHNDGVNRAHSPTHMHQPNGVLSMQLAAGLSQL